MSAADPNARGAGPAPILREATAADLPAVLALNQANVPEVGPTTLERLAMFRTIAERFIVAEDEHGALCAFLILLAEDAEQAAALNAALWTLSDTDFLPHVMADDALAGQTPILVTHQGAQAASDADALPHHDMLVSLTRATPELVDRFARVFEIISTDEADAAAGRKRYAAYKQQSYPLTHFVAGK